MASFHLDNFARKKDLWTNLMNNVSPSKFIVKVRIYYAFSAIVNVSKRKLREN